MTEQQHPITPPPELVEEWCDEWYRLKVRINTGIPEYVATQAARWGADQELEACCDWLEKGPYGFSIAASASDLTGSLHAARRPKPPSLAEQGQRILVENGTTLDGRVELDPEDVDTIRAALERLKELESKQ